MFIFSDLQYKTDLQNVINVSLHIFDTKTEKLFSFWHIIFILSCMIVSCIISKFLDINKYYTFVIILIILLLFIITLIYNIITKSTEQNCVRGFYHQIETLFFDHNNIDIPSKSF